jgi:hypothetical protein
MVAEGGFVKSIAGKLKTGRIREEKIREILT